MLMIHGTAARNLPSVMRRGLLAGKSRGVRRSVWLCTPGLVGRAIAHAMKRHGLRADQVALVVASVPRSWLRAGRAKGIKHTGGRDVPPDRIVSAIVLQPW